MKELRHQHGALSLESTEARAIFDGEALSNLRPDLKNRARDLIENFMIAANGATAQFLGRSVIAPTCCAFPSAGTALPPWPPAWGSAYRPHRAPPRSKQFLTSRRQADPAGFPGLSLAVIKLLAEESTCWSFQARRCRATSGSR
jgi:ribonuclease R